MAHIKLNILRKHRRLADHDKGQAYFRPCWAYDNGRDLLRNFAEAYNEHVAAASREKMSLGSSLAKFI
jgi:hypothetical protein